MIVKFCFTQVSFTKSKQIDSYQGHFVISAQNIIRTFSTTAQELINVIIKSLFVQFVWNLCLVLKEKKIDLWANISIGTVSRKRKSTQTVVHLENVKSESSCRFPAALVSKTFVSNIDTLMYTNAKDEYKLIKGKF